MIPAFVAYLAFIIAVYIAIVLFLLYQNAEHNERQYRKIIRALEDSGRILRRK